MFKGKAIYNPSGKAGEYAKWACNFYVGCSNGCAYCYLRKGVLNKTMGGSVATLKTCFKNQEDAYEVFEKEVLKNVDELREHGLFFSFTTDPMLSETIAQTMRAVIFCNWLGIPVKILTKRGLGDQFIYFLKVVEANNLNKGLIAYMVTLTGHDELEPGAASNRERVQALRYLKNAGFITGVSIEPIVDFESSLVMIELAKGVCDLFLIGLMSGKRYRYTELRGFMLAVLGIFQDVEYGSVKIYYKDGFMEQAKLSRHEGIGSDVMFVGRDFNLFKS